MNSILKKVANWLSKEGVQSAQMASFRGTYESPVPEQLKK